MFRAESTFFLGSATKSPLSQEGPPNNSGHQEHSCKHFLQSFMQTGEGGAIIIPPFQRRKLNPREMQSHAQSDS